MIFRAEEGKFKGKWTGKVGKKGRRSRSKGDRVPFLGHCWIRGT